MGSGATALERRLVWSAAGLGAAAAAAVALLAGVSWAWWQWALVLAVAVDVLGGIPANSLGSAKRFYHSPGSEPAGRARRLLRDSRSFAAAHLHPFLVAATVPDATWTWAIFWYGACLGGTAVVAAVPLYLSRPVASATVALALVAGPVVGAPPGLEWLGPLLALKLVVAHAVPEEPYRPEAGRAGATARPGQER